MISPTQRSYCRPLGAGRAIWFLIAVAGGLPVAFGQSLGREPERETRLEFSRDIRPILSDNCFHCHGPDAEHREAGLRLDTREGVLASGMIVVPGDPSQSELWSRIAGDDEDLRMPPIDSGKSLSRDERAQIRRWIAEGAQWQEHWAFVGPRRPPAPQVSGAYRVAGEIDRFVAATLQREHLLQSPPADPRTLVRRYYLSLIGIPPEQGEVQAFLAAYQEDSELACANLVDRLLARPEYGERMAVHWFDLVRFANTVGYHGDQDHVIAPYRDYVIQAFNDNLPFDRFTAEQLAGDLLPNAADDQKIASGYNRLLQTSHEGGVQQKEYLAKYSADRVRNFGSVWLGMTVGCAECHDHKFDPLPQRDFYRLAAFFADVDDLQSFRGRDELPTRREPELAVLARSVRLRIAHLEGRLQHLDTGAAADRAAIDRELEALRSRTRRTMVTEAIEPRPIRVLHRGDWMDEAGEVVEPGVPAVFAQVKADGRATRLDLARWATSPENPLTARVFVNRLWRLYFGRGLTPSLEDFGAQGQPPSHPELLDWLACEFIDSGWDIKHVVRLITLSHTFRQSSRATPELRSRDPANQWFARQGRPRLDAEAVRDAALTVSGLLVRELDGPSARPYQPAGYYDQLNFPARSYTADIDGQQHRRGVYVHWQRSYLHPMLKAFDAPSREECTAERAQSNTPQAALVLLNDPTFLEAARVYAVRILTEAGSDSEERLRWAWETALGREPQRREMEALRELVEQDLAEYRADPQAAAALLQVGISRPGVELDPATWAAWTSAARAIFNLNEFITRN